MRPLGHAWPNVTGATVLHRRTNWSDRHACWGDRVWTACGRHGTLGIDPDSRLPLCQKCFSETWHVAALARTAAESVARYGPGWGNLDVAAALDWWSTFSDRFPDSD